MCGPETTDRPRGGALVALNPPVNSFSSICGDLAFHTPGSPASSSATHARLTPSEDCSIKELTNLQVVIQSQAFVELPLQGPLSLGVGGDGIIGRRVSLYSRLASGQDKIVAEGIVGFNFLSQSPPEDTSCPSSPSPSI
ncbi:hypothetical protein NW762_006646 [Fusarium torreyae]|uniref:Uncharacterized protein n=1 Tax=Fusarium torreyae TaxID=1237075 RepID=A0A9W8S306_9HYPO|nr:hypothetical protein NW762_006646 [Fusarium torreyae]